MRLLSAALLGYVAGTRSMLAPAAASCAALAGYLRLENTRLEFMRQPSAAIAFSALAGGELIADKLPFVPSRTKPGPFAARLASGALVGAVVGANGNKICPCAAMGAAGAVIGTFGGAALRSGLAKAFKRDLPAALIEDSIAFVLIGLALQAVHHGLKASAPGVVHSRE